MKKTARVVSATSPPNRSAIGPQETAAGIAARAMLDRLVLATAREPGLARVADRRVSRGMSHAPRLLGLRLGPRRASGPCFCRRYITELAVVRKILEHLGLPPAPTELAPARLPDELGFDFQVDLDPAGAGGAHQHISSDLAGPAGPGPPPDDPGL